MQNTVFFTGLMLLLVSCQSTPGPDDLQPSSLQLLAGTWVFSHFGTPTVWNSDLPDPSSATPFQFRDARISLNSRGEGSMMMAGRAEQIEMEVIDETSSFLKLGVKGHREADPFVYDKNERTLMMPTRLEVNEAKGVLPTYFTRRGN